MISSLCILTKSLFLTFAGFTKLLLLPPPPSQAFFFPFSNFPRVSFSFSFLAAVSLIDLFKAQYILLLQLRYAAYTMKTDSWELTGKRLLLRAFSPGVIEIMTTGKNISYPQRTYKINKNRNGVGKTLMKNTKHIQASYQLKGQIRRLR